MILLEYFLDSKNQKQFHDLRSIWMNFGVYKSNSNSTMLDFYDSQIEKINSQIKTAFDKFFPFSLLPPWLSQFVQLAIHNS